MESPVGRSLIGSSTSLRSAVFPPGHSRHTYRTLDPWAIRWAMVISQVTWLRSHSLFITKSNMSSCDVPTVRPQLRCPHAWCSIQLDHGHSPGRPPLGVGLPGRIDQGIHAQELPRGRVVVAPYYERFVDLSF